ncbi:hypothetical protein IMCC3317_11090 [Kordia antarctica]|uniref:Uncharacterized protein n=1 Tax=Kordia antarctica TaxID=1218801 RepID=A0A7L4ZH33_9FLAO|nr:hypothetical protein [Kordia antarctica]QHI35761.1 hypothetical protein IMCC3317_11090 [Kordia antarctica]
MEETNTNFIIGLIIVGFMLMIAVIVLYFSFKESKKRNEVDDEIEEELKKNK